MADELTKTCDGSDDPAHRCGLHHSTGLANPFGGYECCCGDAWKTRVDECMTGAKRGTPVTLRERMRRAAWAEDRTVDGNTLDAYMTVVTPELERLRTERDDNWAYFQRVCKASGIAEAQMDLMAQMRNSERQRADDLLAERDALKATLERVRALKDKWTRQPGMSELADDLEVALDTPTEGATDA